MAAASGRSLIIKKGTTTIAGVRTTSMSFNNNPVDITTKDNAPWRTLLDNGGIRSAQISVSGVFTDSAVEESVRSDAMSNTIGTYNLVLPNADTLGGSFQITSYQRDGNYDDAEMFSLTLESSGTLTYTAA